MQFGSWLEIFYALNSQYSLFYLELNGERNESINAGYMNPPYISISEDTPINKDSTITFVLSEVIPE